MIQTLLFSAVLIYAAVVDIRTKTVPTHILVMLFLIGIIGFSLNSIQGLLCGFLPMFVTALIFPGLGGGDVKLCALCGFVMGKNVLFALLLGLLSCLVFVPVYCSVKHRPIKGTSFPLVPFLAFGCLAVTFL